LVLLSITLILSLLTNLAAFPVILFRKTRSASFFYLTLYLVLLSIMLVLSLLTNLAAFPVILFRKTRSDTSLA
jgi:hypothetical protein